MRNLNGRFLILVGEGGLEWAEAATLLERLQLGGGLHEPRAMTGQELRAKAQFLCLKSFRP